MLTNNSNVPIPIAVWLASNDYTGVTGNKIISVTTLLKPLRQFILSQRVPVGSAPADVMDSYKAKIGQSVHDSLESAWTNQIKRNNALTLLGIPQKVRDLVKVNPEPSEIDEDTITVYTEQRKNKVINGWTISGEYDFVYQGQVQDYKSTSTYTYTAGTKTEDYILQGSMYRWLDPQIITDSTMVINFLFSDWKAFEVARNPKYPKKPILAMTLPLMSLAQTENFITTKLAQIEEFWDADEKDIPLCTDEQLWRTDPQYKYYKNPEKTTRSTANFDTYEEAAIRLRQDNNVGIIVEKSGKVRACMYCPAFTVCSQKDQLILDGSLELE